MKLRETMVGRGLTVPTEEGDVAYIDLDNGASTPTASHEISKRIDAFVQDVVHRVY